MHVRLSPRTVSMKNEFLQPHEIDELGLGDMFEHPLHREDRSVAILRPERNTGRQTVEQVSFTAEEDILITRADGRKILGLGKGQSIPMVEAVARGFVKAQATAHPTEKKPAKPSESK